MSLLEQLPFSETDLARMKIDNQSKRYSFTKLSKSTDKRASITDIIRKITNEAISKLEHAKQLSEQCKDTHLLAQLDSTGTMMQRLLKGVVEETKKVVSNIDNEQNLQNLESILTEMLLFKDLESAINISEEQIQNHPQQSEQKQKQIQEENQLHQNQQLSTDESEQNQRGILELSQKTSGNQKDNESQEEQTNKSHEKKTKLGNCDFCFESELGVKNEDKAIEIIEDSDSKIREDVISGIEHKQPIAIAEEPRDYLFSVTYEVQETNAVLPAPTDIITAENANCTDSLNLIASKRVAIASPEGGKKSAHSKPESIENFSRKVRIFFDRRHFKEFDVRREQRVSEVFNMIANGIRLDPQQSKRFALVSIRQGQGKASNST